MSERTPMETLRRLEVLLERMEVHWTGSTRETAREALAMIRELREGAVEGFVTGKTGNCRFDDGSTCITSALPSRPALLLTTKPRGEG